MAMDYSAESSKRLYELWNSLAYLKFLLVYGAGVDGIGENHLLRHNLEFISFLLLILEPHRDDVMDQQPSGGLP
jgi:hypothetical protein